MDKTQQEKRVHRGSSSRSSETLDITQVEKRNVTQHEKRKARKSANLAPEIEKAVSSFVKYATETAGFEGLRKECSIVLDLKPEPGTYERFKACSDLNRYPEIPCLDATRVVLQNTDGNNNDYIHANKVKLDKLDREYILTQGPKSNTIEDYWRMIFQEQCVGIVMLCNYTEEGNQNCEEFFPTESTAYKYYGKMFVNNKRIDHLDQYNVYTLEVLPEGCSNSIITRLAHCTTWPEKAVPSSGRMVLRLIRWMEQLEPGCIAVMCSAGVGRTGTFLAIEAMCTRLFKGCESKVKDIVLDIRKQRALCIHNELQYFFVYSTVLDYIRAKMPKYHSKVAKFYADLNKL
ncbi:Protein-tyrosine phosphatase [Oesophagostomum dentatum]|uniref:Protein-tyrosine phosphatase n=1 Tax=Oesophagostomum dentatum TaxID=61180 RepID=A0A0B1S3R8_OESDE|nr:Protein-tyrosine phosphatase [Oesophagostomum dentatum]